MRLCRRLGVKCGWSLLYGVQTTELASQWSKPAHAQSHRQLSDRLDSDRTSEVGPRSPSSAVPDRRGGQGCCRMTWATFFPASSLVEATGKSPHVPSGGKRRLGIYAVPAPWGGYTPLLPPLWYVRNTPPDGGVFRTYQRGGRRGVQPPHGAGTEPRERTTVPLGSSTAQENSERGTPRAWMGTS